MKKRKLGETIGIEEWRIVVGREGRGNVPDASENFAFSSLPASRTITLSSNDSSRLRLVSTSLLPPTLPDPLDSLPPSLFYLSIYLSLCLSLFLLPLASVSVCFSVFSFTRCISPFWRHPKLRGGYWWAYPTAAGWRMAHGQPVTVVTRYRN